MAVFEFLRLSLSVPTMGPLYGDERIEPLENRKSYIEYLFSHRLDFFHKSRLYSYVPTRSDILKQGIIAGFIGKKTSELENLGPDEYFALAPRSTWKASFVIINTNEYKQYIAIEKRIELGSSNNIIEHLIDEGSKSYKGGRWHVDVEFISEKKSFFEAAARYRGQISEISFEFNPPNGLLGFERFKEFDRIAQSQSNAEKSSYSLKNRNMSINPEGEFIESALDYACEGAGKTIMKSGRRIVFDSRQSKKKADVPESLMPREHEATKIAGTAELLISEVEKGKSDD